MDQKGITLVELLIGIAIMGLIATAGASLLSASINANEKGDARAALYQEGLLAMERMVSGVQRCTYLLIPNAHNPTRDVLALSGFINDDNDFYFGDPLFPRIDEDPGFDMNNDTFAGIKGFDDNGDGSIDNGATGDDDEDGLINEDPKDGVDNDGDGLIDEDVSNDASNDGVAGIKGMDDDGDGTVDEGNFKDDDEDGANDEDGLNALVYQFNSGAGTLTESVPSQAKSVVLSSRVSGFQVSLGTPECLLISLTLIGKQGETVSFSEYVYPRNILQKTGKRVR
ncbi:MAG: prepilin-type N-terminal cleavage/methylation domain-containing protein [Pseudomonadota bacterium]